MSNTLNSIIKNLNDIPSQKIKYILNDIVSQFSCPICQDVPTQPYLLPTCGHTFCYDCIKSWFPCNPSCPVCRSIIGENKPILNHMLKNLIDNVISNLQSLIDSQSAIALNNWKIERNKDYEIDKASDFPWLKNIAAKWGRAVVDNEDGVPRCSACHWELVDGHCENCGRTMVGWHDRLDGDEIDDDEDDEEDENLFRQQSTITTALSSDYDDYDDYDNGLNDMPNRFVNHEAEVDDEDEDDEDDDEDDDHSVANIDEYDSDDGFVVDDDDISRIEDSDNTDDENNLHALESDDDDFINTAKKSGISSKPIFTDSEKESPSNSDIVDLPDIGSDNDLIKTTKTNRGKRNSKGKNLKVVNIVSTDEEDITPDPISINLSDDSEDEILKTFRSSKKPLLQDEQEEEDDVEENNDDDAHNNIVLPKSKKKYKHKHKNKHKKSKR
ncbi:hypothetical protein CANINC_000768 [Pichia inconspicua]|uniref:RING-type domain-containing protein n=1 Tax=Pichia inconspicua TaxID=52247 RepID=A0A4T0X5P8_9ASCO|nr:hypothetical protein CANINC_000768 [[Candida] inconspicua]